MANDLNQCTFIGRLGADPETRYFDNGDAVTNIRIAVGRQWKNQAGEKQERTEWVPVSIRGKLAEIAAQYLAKGQQVLVVGEFRTRKYQAQDGTDRYATEIIVDGFSGKLQMLGGKGDPGQRGRDPDGRDAGQRGGQAPSGRRDDDGDIPF